VPAPPTHTVWLRRFHAAESDAVCLICFPHAGGSASAYYPLSQELAGRVDVVAVQYPGRQGRQQERPIDSIDELADAVFAELGPMTGSPFALFGHSMGATVAFEVARRLEVSGQRPLNLFLSGRRAASLHRESWLHLDNDERLLEEVRRLDGTSAEVLLDPALLPYVLPSLRNDYRAIESYRYRATVPLQSGIVALTGDADPHVQIADARAWAGHTTGTFELVVHPGGHFYLQARIPELAADIASRLA